jgi:carnitine O-acetyltransferase
VTLLFPVVWMSEFVAYTSRTHVVTVVVARVEYNENVGKQSVNVLTFDGFGSDFIKKSNNPPDAFVQVAMQLATYRLFGEQVGTYESTQVRPFRHGRTEVTVSFSCV